MTEIDRQMEKQTERMTNTERTAEKEPFIVVLYNWSIYFSHDFSVPYLRCFFLVLLESTLKLVGEDCSYYYFKKLSS